MPSSKKCNWKVIYCPRSFTITCADCPDYDACVAVFDSYDEALAHFHKIREIINPRFISLQYSEKRKVKYDKL